MMMIGGFSVAAGRVSEGAGGSQELAGAASVPARRPRGLEQKETKLNTWHKPLLVGQKAKA